MSELTYTKYLGSINCYRLAFAVTLFVLCQFVWPLHTSVGRTKFLETVDQGNMAAFWQTAWRSQAAAGRSCLWTWVSHCSFLRHVLWLHFHFSLSCIGEGNGNPLQCYCLENPVGGGAWWAAVMGSLRVGHDWAISLSLCPVSHQSQTSAYLPPILFLLAFWI